jgi:hypothetical protein
VVTYRKADIVTTIKVRKLELAGHLVRMSNDKAVKKVFLGKQKEEEKQEDQS